MEGRRSTQAQNQSVSSENSDNRDQIPISTNFEQLSEDSSKKFSNQYIHQEGSSNNSGTDVVDAIEQIMKLESKQEEAKLRSSVITDGRAAEQSYIQSSFDAKDEHISDQEELKKASENSSSNEALNTSNLIESML